MPKVPGAESNLDIIREPSLEGININGGIEEQFWERRLEARQKSQLGSIAIGEPLLTFLRFQSPQRLLECGTRTQDRDPCSPYRAGPEAIQRNRPRPRYSRARLQSAWSRTGCRSSSSPAAQEATACGHAQ